MDLRLIQVGVGEGVVSQDEAAALVVYGLGSCIAMALYHAAHRWGALCHVVLPSSDLKREGDKLAKFGDTAVAWSLEELRKVGVGSHGLVAKIAGGANLLPTSGPLPPVGERNALAVRLALERAGIRLEGTHVGGKLGRTVFFHLATGRMQIRQGDKEPVVL